MKINICKSDYNNRKLKPMPKQKMPVEVIVTSEKYGDETFKCMWFPAPIITTCPRRGIYLGRAVIKGGKFGGIPFHAWENTDSEFIYYRILG